MNDGLGAFIRRRRGELNLTASALAKDAGLTKSHLSQIENGKIGIPGADIRRRVASALKVSHLDLLVAAGEIRPDEIEDAGKKGATIVSSEVQEILSMVAETNWEPDSFDFIRAVLKQINRK